MTRSEIILQLKSEYQAKRTRNEAELDARIREAERVSPEIARLREENSTLAFETMRSIMSQSDPAKCRELAEQMKQRGIFNNDRIRRLLVEAGFGADHLEMRYACTLCRDTGLVGDAPSRFCACFENAIRERLYEDGSMAALREQCFESFDITRFPAEDGQRDRMESIRRACEDYANTLPTPRFENIVMTGSSGLGKTFLLNCIYERAVSRGIPAVRVTAFRLFEEMRRQHFANGPEDMEFERLLSVPLLLIDDLGSEPMMRNITIEYLFTLLNERMAARLNTVVATNLTPMELRERYGDRVQSRLLDRTRGATIQLSGKDLRHL